MSPVMLTWCALLLLGGVATAQEATVGCELFAAAEENPLGGKQSDPVIFGKPYGVPDLHLQFEEDGNVMRPSKIAVYYIWNWLEYPYPDHPFGVWSSAHDWFNCNVGENGKLTVPSFTVKPRGWYKGFYIYFPWPKKPHFDHVELTLHVEGCAPKLQIDAEDLKRYTGARAIVKVSCNSPQVTVAFRK
jgi:hypothetical protein